MKKYQNRDQFVYHELEMRYYPRARTEDKCIDLTVGKFVRLNRYLMDNNAATVAAHEHAGDFYFEKEQVHHYKGASICVKLNHYDNRHKDNFVKLKFASNNSLDAIVQEITDKIPGFKERKKRII